MNEILQQLGRIKIIPVIALDEAETAVPLGQALLDGGLPCAEITFYTAAGGIKLLKAIGAPYGGVKFIPTGGINKNNLADYLRLPMVHACGGSFMVKKEWLAVGQFDKVKEAAAQAVAAVQQITGQG